MRCQFLCLLVFGLCVSGVAADAPLAQIPYSQLLDYQQRVDSLRDLKQLKVWEHVSSKRREVKPADIKLIIMRDAAHGGPLPIPLDQDGVFTLPELPALKAEDPMVLSNQPKGTMVMSVTWEIIAPTVTDMRYRELILGVQQYNEAMHRQGFMAALLAPKAIGLLLVYPDGGHRLTLHAAGGDQAIPSKSYKDAGDAVKGIDMSGMSAATTLIYLPLDDALLKQDPTVTLDSLPEAVSAAYD
ncbi:MAG TPA: hypothetical protein VGH71_06415 [Gammaproteobacteria bacterium]